MQTDTGRLSALIERLREVGKEPPRSLFDEILEYGQQAVEPLIQLVKNYPAEGLEVDENVYWAVYHAINLLGELRAPEAVQPILALLDEDDDYVDGLLPGSLAFIGQPAVEPLRAALFAPDAYVYGVVRAASALAKMADKHPELRPELVKMVTDRFEADIPNDEHDILLAFLASNLADLRAVDAVPLVRRAYEDGRLDASIIDLKTFESIVNRADGVSPGEAIDALLLHRPLAPVLPELAPVLPELTVNSGELASPVPHPFGRKIGRNEQCPCGSGKKYKRCHGR
jgi:hypothetical protein